MVKLGESNVPLTDDILKQKKSGAPDFMKSWSEWATQNSSKQLVIRFNKNGAGTFRGIDVPENETFFITSIMLSLNTGANFSTANVGFLSFTDAEILQLSLSANSHESISLSFPMPLEVRSRDTVRLSNTGAGALATACVQGFFLSKRIS